MTERDKFDVSSFSSFFPQFLTTVLNIKFRILRCVARTWKKYLKILRKFLLLMVPHVTLTHWRNRKINIASEKIRNYRVTSPSNNLSNSHPSLRKTWNFGYNILFFICKTRRWSCQYSLHKRNLCMKMSQ